MGELIFKLMMQKAVINTRALATYLRENIINMDTYMSTVNLDIKNFNQYVKVNVDGLIARGERTDDLMINLFKAYQEFFNRDFVRYIKPKEIGTTMGTISHLTS